jgi:hypothetical protein
MAQKDRNTRNAEILRRYATNNVRIIVRRKYQVSDTRHNTAINIHFMLYHLIWLYNHWRIFNPGHDYAMFFVNCYYDTYNDNY